MEKENCMANRVSILLKVLFVVLLTHAEFAFAICADPGELKLDEHRKAINSELMKGTVVLDVTDKIEFFGCYIATLDVYPEEIQVPSTSLGSSGVAEQGVEISKLLQATAISSDLDVVEKSPIRQVLNPDGSTTWEWELYPNKEGLLRVTFTLSAIVPFREKDEVLVLETWKRTVEFNATTSDRVSRFLKDHWKWLISVVLIPLVVWGFNLLRNQFRRKKTERRSILLPGDDDYRK